MAMHWLLLAVAAGAVVVTPDKALHSASPASHHALGETNIAHKRISPELEPTSDTKFFGKDYPSDNSPGVNKVHNFLHPYPKVQPKSTFADDYVKDGNIDGEDEHGDGGTWKLQMDHDILQQTIKKSEEKAKEIQKEKEKEEKELADARAKGKSAETKAEEEIGSFLKKANDAQQKEKEAKKKAEAAEEEMKKSEAGKKAEEDRLQEEQQQQDYTVCLTTVPWRIGYIERTVDSLLNQRPLAPSKIILSVPENVRGQTVKKDDLRWVEKKHNNRLVIHRTLHDFGPATKLMGCLEVIPESEDTCLIVTDDDMLRPLQWAQLLLHQHRCTAGHGRVAGGYSDGHMVHDQIFGHMVHGYRGWAVHRSFLSFAKLHAFWERYHDSCFYVDDEMFTGYLRSQCLAIDDLYSNDADHIVPKVAELISDSSMHDDGKFKGLSEYSKTGGPRMAQACRIAIKTETNRKC